MVVISVYTYGVKIIKKFRWESGFLWGGFHLCTNGSAGYLMQLSVNHKCSFLFSVFPQLLALFVLYAYFSGPRKTWIVVVSFVARAGKDEPQLNFGTLTVLGI